ncbi:MAG TPA: hypothetical protein VM869_26195 [Enhygromyxa sp.]|nr:hypothetical protein [Enhygromyxa sp.]
MSNRTKAIREGLWGIAYLTAIPVIMCIWPYSVAQTLWGRRERARLSAAGKLVTAVEAGEGGWRLKFSDASSRELALDEIRSGTCYEFDDHRSGMAQTSWQTVLTLELAAATLILVGPVSEGENDDPLAELRKTLIAAGRIRGPVYRTVGVIPDLLDFAMAALWLLALFVLGMVLYA